VQHGKVTVGLASHWLCITDNSGISTYGFTTLETELRTPPTLLWHKAHFTFILNQHERRGIENYPSWSPHLHGWSRDNRL